MPAPRYTRRSALRLGGLGIATAVAGCASSDREAASPTATESNASTPTATETATPETEPSGDSSAGDPLAMGDTATSSDGTAVTVSEPRLQSIIVTPDTGVGTHSRPAGAVGSQFLSVGVSTDGTEINSLELDAVLDGRSRERERFRHSFSPGRSGTLSFRLPVVEAQSGAVEWRPSSSERYRWELPASVVSSVGAAPSFEVTAFDVPETIRAGESFTATLTVSNTGDRDGGFRAVILDQAASSLPLASGITVPVPTGERVTREISGATVTESDSPVTAVLDWGIDRREATFSVGAAARTDD